MKKLYRTVRDLILCRSGVTRALTWDERLVLHILSVMCLLVLLVSMPFTRSNYRRQECTAAEAAAADRETWTPGTPYPPAGDAGSAVG